MSITSTPSTDLPPPGMDSVLRRRPSPHLEWVEIDGEIVAWIQEPETLHRLDRIATLIFQLCDGVSPLGQTVLDLAEAFGQDPTELESDVIECVARLVENGLVEDTRGVGG